LCTVQAVDVDINISHTWRSDLIVDLRSPMGSQVRLHAQTGGSADNIIGNYPGTLSPAASLNTFNGTNAVGNWSLIVSDAAAGDTGTLNSWGLNIQCL